MSFLPSLPQSFFHDGEHIFVAQANHSHQRALHDSEAGDKDKGAFSLRNFWLILFLFLCLDILLSTQTVLQNTVATAFLGMDQVHAADLKWLDFIGQSLGAPIGDALYETALTGLMNLRPDLELAIRELYGYSVIFGVFVLMLIAASRFTKISHKHAL